LRAAAYDDAFAFDVGVVGGNVAGAYLEDEAGAVASVGDLRAAACAQQFLHALGGGLVGLGVEVDGLHDGVGELLLEGLREAGHGGHAGVAHVLQAVGAVLTRHGADERTLDHACAVGLGCVEEGAHAFGCVRAGAKGEGEDADEGVVGFGGVRRVEARGLESVGEVVVHVAHDEDRAAVEDVGFIRQGLRPEAWDAALDGARRGGRSHGNTLGLLAPRS
jgi:hypothetical protein